MDKATTLATKVLPLSFLLCSHCLAGDLGIMPSNVEATVSLTAPHSPVILHATAGSHHRGTFQSSSVDVITITADTSTMSEASKLCYSHQNALDLWTYYPDRRRDLSVWVQLFTVTNGSRKLLASSTDGVSSTTTCWTKTELADVSWVVSKPSYAPAQDFPPGQYETVVAFTQFD